MLPNDLRGPLPRRGHDAGRRHLCDSFGLCRGELVREPGER